MRVISPMRTDNYAASCAVGALAFTSVAHIYDYA